MTSAKAQQFIGKHISRHRKMGMGEKQAVAVALHEARDKGFSVPPAGVRSMEKTK